VILTGFERYLLDKKVLRETKPVDLPVEQPTRIEIVINLAAAKKLGVKLPGQLLVRADKVIERTANPDLFMPVCVAALERTPWAAQRGGHVSSQTR
jgi:hypothetical protein